MGLVLVLCRLALAGVFVVSGIGKLLDLAGSQQAMRDFGVPEPLAKPAGIALPLVELGIALLLLPVAASTGGAILALLLLAAFIAAIGVNLARGNRPNCNCFGQIHSAPIGWKTLARNSVLAALALVVAVAGLAGNPGPGLFDWTRGLAAAGWLAVAAFVVIDGALAGAIWLLVHLMGQHGRLITRLDGIEAALATADIALASDADEDEDDEADDEEDESDETTGLPVDSPAPRFTLRDVFGKTTTLAELCARGKLVLLVFVDPASAASNALLPDVGRWQRDYGERLTVIPISRGAVEANKPKAEEHGLTTLLLQRDNEVAEQYEVETTPSAVLVSADGNIFSSPLLTDPESIRNITAMLGESRQPQGQPDATAANIGQAAPDFSLPDLDGKTVRLADFQGQPTAVLFWRPGCGFCQRMLDDLKAWEANPPDGAPRLVIVSSEDLASNRAQGLRSPVVLDPEFGVGNAFGATGTPSAVLIDAEGKIASGVAVGAPDVLSMLRGERAAAPAPAPAAQPTAETDEPAGLRIGDPVPAIELAALAGRKVRLSSLRGQATTLIFWDPTNLLCQDTLLDLRQRDANAPADAPRMVVIATGDIRAIRAMRLRSRVLLDPTFETGQAFAALGTPGAVLIDAEGRVASEVVYGIRSILALTNGQDPTQAPPDGANRIGIAAPALELTDVNGQTTRLSDFKGESTLVLLWDPNCGFCQRMLPDLKRWEAAPPEGAPKLLVASRGDADAIKALGLQSRTLLDPDLKGPHAFRAYGTPSAVLIDAEGKIASPIAVGAPQVFALANGKDLSEAVDATAGSAPAAQVGDVAPAIALPDLDGNQVELATFQGERTLVLFWNPTCGFCQRMLPDLKQWEANPPAGAPKLLVVSTGEVEANRALGLQSTVVLDQVFATGGAFGATGTPSAVLVDADGRVASSIAVGAPAVFELAASGQASAAVQ